MDQLLVQKYGIKAASLMHLKKIGLFPKKIIIVEKVPELEKFKELLEKHDLIDKTFGIRFSPKEPQLCIKSKHRIKDWQKGYQFLKEYIHQGTAIIQEHTQPEYMGTLYFGKKQIIINLVPGTWASSACDSCDVIEIDEKIKYYKYTKERYALYGGDTGFEPMIVKPFTEEQINLLVNKMRELLPKFEPVRKERRMIEFILDEELNFLGMELKESKETITEFKQLKIPEIFEIKEIQDIKSWDKNKDLLISVKLGRDHPPEFIEMLKEIKQHKDSVFIKYGLLSHPAILMREQGLETKQYSSNYGLIEFDR